MFFSFNHILFFVFCIAAACTSNSNEKEVKLESGKKNNEKTKPFIIEKEDTLKAFFDFYNHDSILMDITKINVNTEKSFIQRFPNKKMTSLLLESNNFIAKHLQIDYIDSNSMKNAFFNFLDCYGKECKSIEFYQKAKFSKTFFMLIATTKSIHIIESENNLNQSKWINYVRFTKIADPIKFIIIQKKQQKAKWFSYSNYLLTEIK